MKKLDSKVATESDIMYFKSQELLLHQVSHCMCFSMQVNIIPVIAKADTVSKSELDKLKIKIMSELVSNGVQIYQFPTEDEAVAEINSSMNVSPRIAQTTHIYYTKHVLLFMIVGMIGTNTVSACSTQLRRQVSRCHVLYHYTLTKAPLIFCYFFFSIGPI